MKLFITACLKDYQDDIYEIFKQAKINVFSASEVIGFKNNQSLDLMEEWFASGDEKFDSMFIFSFTTAENAELGMELIKKYNRAHETNFPVRAFIVPVEKASY